MFVFKPEVKARTVLVVNNSSSQLVRSSSPFLLNCSMVSNLNSLCFMNIILISSIHSYIHNISHVIGILFLMRRRSSIISWTTTTPSSRVIIVRWTTTSGFTPPPPPPRPPMRTIVLPGSKIAKPGFVYWGNRVWAVVAAQQSESRWSRMRREIWLLVIDCIEGEERIERSKAAAVHRK